MRINGFTKGETIGYVARESVITFLLGISFGIIVGIVVDVFFVPVMESAQIMFARNPYPFAWVMAFAFNATFTVVIDLITFRKIFKVPITDINKY